MSDMGKLDAAQFVREHGQEPFDYDVELVREAWRHSLDVAIAPAIQKAQQYEVNKSDVPAEEMKACLWWICDEIRRLKDCIH